MNIDLADYTQNAWGNVLSIGVKINVWSEGNKWHVYYQGYTKKLRLQCIYSYYNYMSLEFPLENPSEIEVIINKKGAYLNGELKSYNHPSIAEANKVFIANPISIGSQEGVAKGIAKYNLVCLRKYQERG